MKARAEITHVFNLEKCIRCLNYTTGCPLGQPTVDMQAIRDCTAARREESGRPAPTGQPGSGPQT